jgi:tripartite ATP-independent transporter DctM subunit
MIGLLFLTFAILLAAGVPVAFSIGVSALLVIVLEPSLSLPVMITKTFAGMDSFPMMAIPFFILAGEIMSRSGLTDRIVAFASSLVGHIRGGLAHVNIIANMIMAGVSGSAAADCSATGSILIPAMIRDGYRRDFSALVTAFAAMMGPMIPPSIFMIIYGTIAGVSVGALFLGGIVPGVMIGLFLMILVAILTRGASYAVPKGRFAWSTVWRTAREAVWALIMPIIVVGGILGGLMTPTEAGIIAVVYSFLVGVFRYRQLSWHSLRRIVMEGAIASANIMLVVGFAAVFGNLLTLARFDDLLLRLLLQTTSNPSLIVAEIIVSLMLIGGIMDEIATAFMFVPSLAAIGAKLGYDPVHFGVVMVLAILLGAVVPPVATLLFVGCSLAQIPLSAIMRLVWIFLLPLVLVTFLIAYIPPLVTAIPRLFFQ